MLARSSGFGISEVHKVPDKGDGDVNRAQGHIQSASKSGMRAGMHTTTVEQSKKH